VERRLAGFRSDELSAGLCSADARNTPEVITSWRQALSTSTVHVNQRILSTVSGWYAPIQYPDAFSVFAPAVEQFGLTIEAAGALGKGEKA